MSPSTASNALVALHSQGLLDRDLVGSSHLYRVNDQHVLVTHLRRLLATAADSDLKVVEYLRKELRCIQCIVLYGSRARGTVHPTSDIDILVIHTSNNGQRHGDERRHVLRNHLTKLIGIEMSITSVLIPKPSEVATAFWRNIGRDGVCLWGDLPAHLRIDHGK